MPNYFGFPVINGYRSDTPKGYYHPIKHHTGIDLSCPIGTSLSLPIETKVEIINKQKEMGLTLYLSDEKGNILVFAHLDTVTVKLGYHIPPNMVFAKTGNSGTATTGPHCHVEIIAKEPEPGLEFMTRSLSGFDGYNIDPAKYLDEVLTPHWSDEEMEWAVEHEIISYKRNPDEVVRWGEFIQVVHNATEKAVEWSKNDNPK